jgi:hypothetical protein
MNSIILFAGVLVQAKPNVFVFFFYFESGGTISGSLWRVVGTLIGSFMGWAAIAANGGPYVIVLFGFLLCEFTRFNTSFLT